MASTTRKVLREDLEGPAVEGYVEAWRLVGLLALVGALIVVVAFGVNRLLRPSRPTAAKISTYECGLDPVGDGWAQSQIRFYVYAYLYVIFAVDAVYLFPWATVFDAPGYGVATLVEMFVFIGFLSVGLLYAFRRGVLRWT